MADISKRPDSSSSRSAWNDDGLDAPGRPVSGDSAKSNAEKRNAKSAVSTVSRSERRKKSKKTAPEKKENFCQKIVNSIWSTRHTQDLVDNEAKAKTVLRELIIYLIFLVIVCAVTFGMTSPTHFIMTQVMTDLFVNSIFLDTGNTFAGQLTHTDFWRFAEGPMLDGLYWEKYYNNENLTQSDLGYIYYENKLLGVPRLRQLRVKNDSCTVYPLFEETIESCYAAWSKSVNDESPYGLETETAWVFHNEQDMNGTSSRGILVSSYPGSGYYQDLAVTRSKTSEIVAELKENRWIDRGTRVVFLDFTMYNPNVNLFSAAKLTTEYPASGGAVASAKFTTVKLLRYVSVTDYILLGCEFVFSAFVLYYLVEESLELKKQGFKMYFSEFWNWMDAAVISLSLVCIAFNIYRTITVNRMVEELLSTPDQFVNFERLANWQIQFNNTVAIMAFLAWFKLFKYISFNKTMTQLTDTISQAKKDLSSFLIMFFIVFFAFAQVGYLLFGTVVADFRTIKYSILTQLRIILGDFNFAELENAHFALGPIYFLFYIVVVFFILFNMFLAIINDTYSSVKADPGDGNEFEVVDFFKSQYNKMLEKMNLKRDRITDIQDALRVADVDDDNEIAFEEWKNELMARGYQENEIEEAFKKFDLDGNRVLDKREQAEMLRTLEEEKKALNEDIDQVEDKLGVKENRPKTSGTRPGTRAKTGRGKRGQTPDADKGSKKPAAAAKVVSEVGYNEFTTLTRRVDRMELSIGSIVSKIDTVLVKLEGMERAKLRRREAMTQLLDSIAGSEDATEEMKREQMERLVREELERWDSEAVISRPGSAISRPGTSRSRPGTGYR